MTIRTASQPSGTSKDSFCHVIGIQDTVHSDLLQIFDLYLAWEPKFVLNNSLLLYSGSTLTNFSASQSKSLSQSPSMNFLTVRVSTYSSKPRPYINGVLADCAPIHQTPQNLPLLFTIYS